MRDKYGTSDDPYLISGATVLRNKLNIQSEKLLDEAERDISTIAAAEIEFCLPPYDFQYLCKIHQSLFGDIYDWAGQLRHIDISKGDTRFCNVSRLTKEADKLFDNLAKDNYLVGLPYQVFIEKLAEYYCDINMLHPFRDGNGRAQRILFEHIIINCGYKISFESVAQDEWLEANVYGVYCQFSKMAIIFNRCIDH